MRPIRGILYKLIAVTAFIVMSSMVKAVSGTIPPGEAVFFRSAFALPVILGWLLYQGDLRTGLKTRRPISHFWRGFIGTCAMGMGFAALAFLPLPEVTAIGYAAPLLVVVFAAIFLGEEVRMFRFTAVLVGLAGVTIVLAPSLTIGASLDHAQALGAMLALMGAVCAALAQVTVRRLIATEKTATIVFWFSVTATGLSLFTIPYGWVLPSAPQLAILVLTGLVGGPHAATINWSTFAEVLDEDPERRDRSDAVARELMALLEAPLQNGSSVELYPTWAGERLSMPKGSHTMSASEVRPERFFFAEDHLYTVLP